MRIQAYNNKHPERIYTVKYIFIHKVEVTSWQRLKSFWHIPADWTHLLF